MTASPAALSADMVDRLAGVRVVVVGDAMLDRYVYGTAERLSPEAPVPVLHVSEQRAMLGGAGNVVRTLSALGVGVRFISAVGDDARGREIAALCADLPGAEATLVATPGRQTSLKTRFVAGGQQLLRADEEDNGPVADAVADNVAAAVTAALDGAGALILSDYGKGLLTPALLRVLIDTARAAGVPVLVDPKGSDYSRYRGAFLVTPNRAELALASGMPVDGDAETEAAARTLAADAGIDAVLATRGRDGMTLLAPDGSVEHAAAEALEVFDVSGAGDTVIGTAAAAIAAGLPLATAMRLANAAAGVVVAKIGTAVARPAEIAAALERSAAPGAFFERARAVEQAAAWRARGLSVGFANGCFDLLHPGHIHLLRQARAACDRLIVALNTDASVRRLKGPDRPVRAEGDRAAVIAALDMVDLVTLFDEDTPEALIEALRPDVLVKGADYERGQVVGGDFVESYGGRVLLAELLADHSTTATIDRLKKSGE